MQFSKGDVEMEQQRGFLVLCAGRAAQARTAKVSRRSWPAAAFPRAHSDKGCCADQTRLSRHAGGGGTAEQGGH